MNAFLENAQRIFDVARDAASADASGADSQFALLVHDDGALHFIMETPVSLEGASAYSGARTAYRVTRSAGGVRVEGRSIGKNCLIEEYSGIRSLLPDRPLYLITSPLLTSSS